MLLCFLRFLCNAICDHRTYTFRTHRNPDCLTFYVYNIYILFVLCTHIVMDIFPIELCSLAFVWKATWRSDDIAGFWNCLRWSNPSTDTFLPDSMVGCVILQYIVIEELSHHLLPGAVDIYICRSHSESLSEGLAQKGIAATIVSSKTNGISILNILTMIWWRWMRSKRERKKKRTRHSVTKHPSTAFA